MAINAKFQADFAGFIHAVDQAEIALVDMSKGAGKVETTLNRMTDNFSGRKVIQEAALMTVAIENAGGAATLTATELEHVGRVTNEAADKMKAMGLEVPAGIQKIADQTREVEGRFGSLKGLATDVAAGLIGMFSLRAGVGFVEDVVKQASALQDLSNKTHIGVEDLQAMTSALSQAGITGEELGKAMFSLSQKISGDDKSVEKGLQKLGLSLADVKGLEGEQLFLAMERGLSQLQGGLRDNAAAELFGSKLGGAMAGAADDIDGTVAAAHRLNTVMSADTVAALDTFGESLERAQGNLTAIAANMIGPVAQGFNALVDAAGKGATKSTLLWAAIRDGFDAVTGMGTGTEHLATAMDDANQKFAASTPKVNDATGAQKNFSSAADASSDSVKKLKDDVKKFGEVMDEVHKSTFELAMQHEKQWRDESGKLLNEHNKEVIDGLTQNQKAEQDLIDFYAKSTLSSTDYQILKIREVVAEQEAAFKGTVEQRVQFNATVEELANAQADFLKQKEREVVNAAVQAAIDAANALNSIIPDIGHGPTTPNGEGPPPIVVPPIKIPPVFHDRGTGGGSTNITIHVTQPLGTPSAIGQAVTASMRNSGIRLPTG